MYFAIHRIAPYITATASTIDAMAAILTAVASLAVFCKIRQNGYILLLPLQHQ
jgi:hypothetical protein